MEILNVLKCRLEIVDDAVSSRQLVDQLISDAPRTEEPLLHLTELDCVVKRHYDWLRNLPRVRPYYTVGSNDDVRIIGTTALLDCGYVCSSKAEVLKVLEFRVDPGVVLLERVGGNAELLRFARRKDVRVVFDSEEELRMIHQYFPEAEVLIRFRLGEDVQPGCQADGEARDLLNLAKELNMDVIGWCFNAGSFCCDPAIFYTAISKGREITDHATIVGFNFKFINLGVGVCGQKDVQGQRYASYINRALEDYFPERRGWTIAAEVGSFHSAAAVTAITAIRGKRIFWNQRHPSRIDQVFYYVSGRVERTSHSLIHASDPVCPIVWKDRDECGVECRTTLYEAGSDECICKDLLLPELNENDFMVFESQGNFARRISKSAEGVSCPITLVYVRRSMW
ncbi:hypothetical protein quinque_001235 [Culex quinquefasciatus]